MPLEPLVDKKPINVQLALEMPVDEKETSKQIHCVRMEHGIMTRAACGYKIGGSWLYYFNWWIVRESPIMCPHCAEMAESMVVVGLSNGS